MKLNIAPIALLVLMAIVSSGCPSKELTVTISSVGADSAGLLAVNPNSTVVLIADAYGGTTPYSIQWYKNGIKIPGATGTQFFIFNVAASNAGNYYCVVTDSDNGQAKSDSITTEANR